MIRSLARFAPLSLVIAASPSLAALGSFGPNDGYSLSVYSGTYNWCDVSYYNAGAYGPNAGGGSGPTFITPDSGRWRVMGPVGGFFGTAANRAAATGGAPPYPTSAPPGAMPAYMVGAHFNGRNNDGYNLAFRNDTPAGTGAAIYEYDLDIYDTGGPVPSSVTSGTVGNQFYFMADPDLPNGHRMDKFTLSYKDSLGNIGLEFGYGRDNIITWRANPSGPWNYTPFMANAAAWDGLRVSIDLTADTFGMDYFDVINNQWNVLAPAGTALGNPMQNFTTLRWQLEDNVFLGLGGKNMFDDFSFTIPAPSGVLALVMGAAPLLRRRRK